MYIILYSLQTPCEIKDLSLCASAYRYNKEITLTELMVIIVSDSHIFVGIQIKTW